ncbi:MAG: insulinase family protein [Cyclobacteriaceae bacterium]
MREYEVLELANGIRVIHKEISHTKIAHVSIMLDIGSRDETEEEQGLTHFWEHMAFKGTKKRKAFHIINRLETLGGELNAYTTKEKICFYASVLQNHLDKAVELLADITFNSTFPDRQIEKERMVILEEMSMYKDTPEDAIQDELDELVFGKHPLGSNILGTDKTVASFKKAHFEQFLAKHLNTTRIIVSSVGNYPMKKLERIINKYLVDIPYKNHTIGRLHFEHYEPSNGKQHRDIMQAHYAAGIPSYGLKDEKRIPFFLLTNVLGGPAMTSRLNLALREKYGYVYGADAHFTSYTDVGMFFILFATDPKHMNKCKKLVEKELDRLKNKPLGALQLHNAKQQLKGQLAMSEENNNSMMLMMAKSLLDLQTVPSLNNLFKKIDNATSEQLMELAVENFDTSQMSTLTYLPQS